MAHYVPGRIEKIICVTAGVGKSTAGVDSIMFGGVDRDDKKGVFVERSYFIDNSGVLHQYVE